MSEYCDHGDPKSTEAQGSPVSLITEPQQTFAEFYAMEHEGQVRRAFLLLGAAASAHDVVADAFLAVYRRWDSIESPGPYLNRCVLNGCRDWANRRVRETPSARDPHEVPDVRDKPPEAADHLGELLLELPFRQRAAVVLRFYGGHSEAEIAEALECRPGTVGSLIHRALAALRKDLA